MHVRGLACWLLITPGFAVSLPARAGDFRVETDVFLGDEQRPIAETLTLFSGDVVYDFLLTEPVEITIFDARRGRLMLLDPARRVRGEVTTGELLEFTAAIQARSSGDRQQSLFTTDIHTALEESTGDVLVEASSLKYRGRGKPHAAAEERERFHAFANWFARLNAARSGNPPPFARLALNQQLADAGQVPEEITRTLLLPGRFLQERQVVRSRHAFTGALSTTDRRRIQEAATFNADFQTVPLADYWQLPQTAAAQ